MIGIDPTPPSLPSIMGQSLGVRLSMWRALLARGQLVAQEARVWRTRVASLEPVSLPATSRLEPLEKAELRFENTLRELADHLRAEQALAERRAVARTSGAHDLEIVDPSSLSGDLGVLPILGLAIAGAISICAVSYAYISRLQSEDLRRLAALVETGRDITPLVSFAQGSTIATTAKGVSSITTPLAIAGGIVGLAMLAKAWKAR